MQIPEIDTFVFEIHDGGFRIRRDAGNKLYAIKDRTVVSFDEGGVELSLFGDTVVLRIADGGSATLSRATSTETHFGTLAGDFVTITFP